MAQDNRFAKSKKTNNFWHSPLVLFGLFLIIILFSYNMIGLLDREIETEKNKISELNKIDELTKRKEILSKDINTLNTSEGVEMSVRDKFQVVKPGEKMVVIVDEQKSKAPPEAVDHSFWGYIKRMFGQK